MDFRLLRQKAKQSRVKPGGNEPASPAPVEVRKGEEELPPQGKGRTEEEPRAGAPPSSLAQEPASIPPTPPPEMLPETSPSLLREGKKEQVEEKGQAPLRETGELREYLWFRIAGEDYVVPLKDVDEVVRLLPITFVPRVPPWIKGIVSLRGEMIPVVDLRVRLGFAGEGNYQRIMICFRGEERCGFLVEEVRGVVRVRQEEWQEVPAGLEEKNGRLFLRALVRRGTHLFGELDLIKIIAFDA